MERETAITHPLGNGDGGPGDGDGEPWWPGRWDGQGRFVGVCDRDCAHMTYGVCRHASGVCTRPKCVLRMLMRSLRVGV